MSVQLTISVPDALGRQLEQFRGRLTEVLERGLRELTVENESQAQDENEIMSLLVSLPAPEQVLSIRPSPEMQARVSILLAQNKRGELSRGEEVELERYLMLEHLVRLAKLHAYRQMHIKVQDAV